MKCKINDFFDFSTALQIVLDTKYDIIKFAILKLMLNFVENSGNV